MNYKSILGALGLGAFGVLVSCSGNKQISGMETEFTPVDTIFYDANLDTLPPGQICGIQWLSLKGSEDGIFKGISKLYVNDSLMVVVDKSACTVAAFTLQGELLYKLNERGQGPAEYLELAAATVTDSLIYIVDNYSHRIQRYALSDGSYAGAISLPFVARDIEAFSDNDFLFTCMASHPDSQIIPKPIDFAVWRTDSTMEVKQTYLPLPENHYELIGKRVYFVKDNQGNINFHFYEYPGYFTFTPNNELQYHHISFYNGIPAEENLDYDQVNEKGYAYLSETPHVYNDKWCALASEGEYTMPMIGLGTGKKIVRNSMTSATNLLFNIVGVNHEGFIGYLDGDYSHYQALTTYGFPSADSIAEKQIEQGAAALIFYKLCQD
ncbi:MAG: 6-bladed beta-propeller [Muribaculaceae bacterium]|nr:6-bladed beta-propeller [Muribaculaceae bacterium]